MKYIVLLFSFLCSSLILTAQNRKIVSNDTLGSKQVGEYITYLTDYGDSLRKLYERQLQVNESLMVGKDSLFGKYSLDTSLRDKISLNDYVVRMNLWIAIAILAFAVILVGGILIFLYKMGKGFGRFAFQTIGLVIVITASLFLIVTGYNKEQMTPVVGLFGTIVGFIFGSNLRPPGNTKDE